MLCCVLELQLRYFIAMSKKIIKHTATYCDTGTRFEMIKL